MRGNVEIRQPHGMADSEKKEGDVSLYDSVRATLRFWTQKHRNSDSETSTHITQDLGETAALKPGHQTDRTVQIFCGNN